MPTVTLLMTRPQGAARRFVRALPAPVRDRLSPCYSPLVNIVPVAAEPDLDGVKGVIFTSINGVNAASAQTARRDRPAYCVGRATTAAARRAGWTARMMGETAAALTEAMRAAPVPGPLLHLAGRHVWGDFAGDLTAAGCAVRRQVVYDQQLRDLTPVARRLIAAGGPIIAPLFSPRTARQFAGQCPAPARLRLIALSPAVADPLSGLRDSTLTLCDRPDADSMAGHIEKVLNMLCRVERIGGAQ